MKFPFPATPVAYRAILTFAQIGWIGLLVWSGRVVGQPGVAGTPNEVQVIIDATTNLTVKVVHTNSQPTSPALVLSVIAEAPQAVSVSMARRIPPAPPLPPTNHCDDTLAIARYELELSRWYRRQLGSNIWKEVRTHRTNRVFIDRPLPTPDISPGARTRTD
jgi:hypothetical protein